MGLDQLFLIKILKDSIKYNRWVLLSSTSVMGHDLGGTFDD
jgi:hypothetical protein